jgi:hypothetical protein
MNKHHERQLALPPDAARTAELARDGNLEALGLIFAYCVPALRAALVIPEPFASILADRLEALGAVLINPPTNLNTPLAAAATYPRRRGPRRKALRDGTPVADVVAKLVEMQPGRLRKTREIAAHEELAQTKLRTSISGARKARRRISPN